MLDTRQRQDLDRHITGNYGEDQFKRQRRAPSYRQLRRAEGDWHRRMERSEGVMRLPEMFALFCNPAFIQRRSSKIQAYRDARYYITGGRCPVTLPARVRFGA